MLSIIDTLEQVVTQAEVPDKQRESLAARGPIPLPGPFVTAVQPFRLALGP